MTEYAIRAERLGKRYAIGERLRYRTLRDAIAGTGKRTWDRIRQGIQARSDGEAFDDADSSRYIWALNDVSFAARSSALLDQMGRARARY